VYVTHALCAAWIPKPFMWNIYLSAWCLVSECIPQWVQNPKLCGPQNSLSAVPRVLWGMPPVQWAQGEWRGFGVALTTQPPRAPSSIVGRAILVLLPIALGMNICSCTFYFWAYRSNGTSQKRQFIRALRFWRRVRSRIVVWNQTPNRLASNSLSRHYIGASVPAVRYL
jgi:membrane protease YdiL (CAAX protease family)